MIQFKMPSKLDTNLGPEYLKQLEKKTENIVPKKKVMKR